MAFSEHGAEDKKLLSEEECANLAHIMNIKHAAGRGVRVFTIAVESLAEKEQGLVRVLLASEDDVFHYPVEARFDVARQALTIRQSCSRVLDFIDAYFESFFAEDEGVYLPIDWMPYDSDGLVFEVRGQVINKKIERMADELLSSGSCHSDEC